MLSSLAVLRVRSKHICIHLCIVLSLVLTGLLDPANHIQSVFLVVEQLCYNDKLRSHSRLSINPETDEWQCLLFTQQSINYKTRT